MSDVGNALVRAIDAHWSAQQGSGHRYHLGASILGRSCLREVWYKFWWWHAPKHTGRILRLFNRGHREEQHAVENLRRLGAVVEDTDSNGRQIKFSHLWGLMGGERDGAVSNLEDYGLVGAGLLEIKTHGEKSFKLVSDKGLLSAKPEHYIQMQMYMAWSRMSWGLYYAVNKNTDDLYCQVVPARPELAAQYTDRAASVIQSRTPPKGVSEDPSWFVCRFCDYKRHCHGVPDEKTGEYRYAEADKNCRTCEHIELRLGPDPEDTEHGHTWVCNLWGGEVPRDYLPKGCDKWTQRHLS